MKQKRVDERLKKQVRKKLKRKNIVSAQAGGDSVTINETIVNNITQGVNNLDELNDVVLGDYPADGDVLTYDSATEKWVNEQPIRKYVEFPSQGDVDQVGNAPVDTGRITAIKKDNKVVLVYSDEHGLRTRIMRDNIVIVRNTSGSGMTKGQVVYPSGATGLFPNVSLSDATAKATLRGSMILVENVADNAYGYAMRLGILENFNTSAFSVGDRLYVSASTPGALTTTAPTIEQSIGIVLVSGVGNGAILVDVETPSTASTGGGFTGKTKLAFIHSTYLMTR